MRTSAVSTSRLGPWTPATFWRAALLGLLAYVITNVDQQWVGRVTIYDEAKEASRLQMHEAVLRNQPPTEGGWGASGASGSNVRVLVIWTAELAARFTGMSVLRIYKGIDSICLFLALIFLQRYLSSLCGDLYALIGVLYVGAILPLTYFLHRFHPWDRPSLLVWILLLDLIRRDRIVPAALLFGIGMTIKYDLLPIPLLYFMAHVERRRLGRTLVRAGLLGAVGLGTLVLLYTIRGSGGDDSREVLSRVVSNISQFRHDLLGHPPFLGFVLLILLAAIGVRRPDRYKRASAAFSLVMLSTWFLLVNFAEMRTEMPGVLLLLPAALDGLAMVLEGSHEGEDATSAPA